MTKKMRLLVPSPARLTALAFPLCLLAVACGKSSERRVHTADTGRVIEKAIPTTPAQTADLEQQVRAKVEAVYGPYFEAHFKAQLGSLTWPEHAPLARAATLAATAQTQAKFKKEAPSACQFAIGPGFDAWIQCVVREVLTRDLSDAQGLRRLIESALHEENRSVLGDLDAIKTSLRALPADILERVAAALVSNSNIEALFAKLSAEIEGIRSSVEILVGRETSLDMPFVAKSFFEGKTFVFTTSFQQASTGHERMYNLDSVLVHLEVNNNRMVIVRETAGLYDGVNSENLIVGSYPIVNAVRTPEGDDYFQVDFSKPENKQFLVTALGDGTPSMNLSADVVVPRVAHAPKALRADLGSGLFFNASDSSFVLDQLVLVNGNKQVMSPGRETSPVALGKDPVRPTVRVVQGLFALDASSEDFSKTQSIDLFSASFNLFGNGVENLGQDEGIPYFTTSPFLPDNNGRAREPELFVRKFNTDKEIVFVIGNNTPEKLVPTLKSAVNAYRDAFAALTRQGKTPPRFSVVTQADFEAANKDAGLRLGSTTLAADPRVNMILWDDNRKLNSAWATAAAHPLTGEVISADVMLSGPLWAKEGCMAFFSRTWSSQSERPTNARPASKVPSTITRFLWDKKCEQTLLNLGIYRRSGVPGGVPVIPVDPEIPVSPSADTNPSAIDSEELMQATRTADGQALARLASKALGRSLKATDMLVDLGVDTGADASRGMALNADAHAHTGGAIPLPAPADMRLVEATRAQLKMSIPSARAFADATEKRLNTLRTLAHSHVKPQQARQTGSQIEIGDGSNSVSAKLDCLWSAMPGSELVLAESLVPAITSGLVKTPEEAAMAMVRAVVLHELGHAFGLRHNFIASTTPGEFEDPTAVRPIKVFSGTDSVMDYNDAGVDIDFGALSDYTSGEPDKNKGDFGVYDLLALASIYDLDISSFKLKSGGKTKFCTDDNVKFIGNCQRFDFGKDYAEFLLLESNLILQRLKIASALDSILEPQTEVWQNLLGQYSSNQLKLAAQWGINQHEAFSNPKVDEKVQQLDAALFAYMGKGGKQDFFTKFKERFGQEPFGVWQGVVLEPSFFSDPTLGEIFADLIRQENIINIVTVANFLRKEDTSMGRDAAFFAPVHDFNIADRKVSFKTDLMNRFARSALIPAGEPLDFTYLDNGTRKSGSEATVDGKPATLTLKTSLFNHVDQVVSFKDFEIDDGAGGKKLVMALANGHRSISQMTLELAALASLAGGYEASESAQRLRADRSTLKTLLTSTCAEFGRGDCYSFAGKAKDAAFFLENVYGELITQAQSIP